MSQIKNVNQIVATGSVDGVLTTAALLRLIGETNVGVEFTQAFEVVKLDPIKWEPNRNVAFVDLAVNNQDHAMTAAFVAKIRDAGHKIVAVIDEHSREDWFEILGKFDGLIVEPVSQAFGDIKSSGALMKSRLGDLLDAHGVELVDSAEAGDRMNFATHFGAIANQAVKSNIGDNTRRVHLAYHLAFNREPDEKIQSWVAEYNEILKNHKAILAAKMDLGDGIVRVDATGQSVDVTSLMAGLYKSGAVVVVLIGEAFNKAEGRKTVQASFGTSDKNLDLLTCVKEASIPMIGGFAQKVNVALEQESSATEVIRKLLKS